MMNPRPAEVSRPGELIREELEERGWTQDDLAYIIGRSPSSVADVIAGKSAITSDTAVGLAAAFGTSAEFWMNREARFQLWRTDQNKADTMARRARLYAKGPLREMMRRGWIESSDSVEVLEKRVLDFFELTNIEQAPEFGAHAARKSTSYNEVTPAQTAWLFRAKQVAQAAPAEGFSMARLDHALAALRLLVHTAEEARHVPRILTEAGIRFVVIEPLAGTRIDGAHFLLEDNSPVIALSMRFDRVDNFWHTLMHEIGHLMHHTDSLDTDMESDLRPESERDADEFAVNYLIPRKELDGFVARVYPLYSRIKVMGFARRLQVHPGIVVGQLQKRGQEQGGLKWSNFRPLLEPIRKIVTAVALTDGWGVRLPASFQGGVQEPKAKISRPTDRFD